MPTIGKSRPHVIDPVKLDAALADAGHSRESFALSVGVGYNAVQAYLLGYSDPSARVLVRMARVLGVHAEDLCRDHTSAGAL